MHQTKYRGIITEAGSLTTPPWEPAFRLVKPPIKSVSPFGGDLCFGWLGSPRLYLYKPLGCVSAFWKWIPARKDKTMQYQKVLKMLESIPYLSVGLDVGADFTWMSIMLPNGTLAGKPFKIVHSDPQSRELAIAKIKEAQEAYSLKTSIIPDDEVIDLRNLVRDYYYFKDLQSAVVLKLTAELKVSFPAYRKVFSKVTTQTSLKLLDACPLAEDLLAAPKDTVVEMIRSTARFGEKYALAKYDALRTAAEDAAIFGRALKSNSVRIRLYIDSYREYQKRLDTIMEAIHASVDGLKDSPVYDHILLLQSLRGVGFISAVVLVAEMGSFNLFPSPKKLYAYFGLDPAVKQSGKFNGEKVHMSKRGSSLARRILHMVALNNLKVDKGSGMPVNPVIHSYYADKCKAKKKNVAVGAVMHKICNIIFAMLRDNKPFEVITPQEHCKRYLAAHPDKVQSAA